MTTIRSGAPRIASTQSASPTAAPAPQAKSSAPSQSASSFQAATGGGNTIKDAMDGGLKVLGELEGSPQLDKIKQLLTTGIPTGDLMAEASKAYSEIAGSLTEEQRKPLEKAISTQMIGRSVFESFKQMLEKAQQEALAASKR